MGSVHSISRGYTNICLWIYGKVTRKYKYIAMRKFQEKKYSSSCGKEEEENSEKKKYRDTFLLAIKIPIVFLLNPFL